MCSRIFQKEYEYKELSLLAWRLSEVGTIRVREMCI